MKALLLREYLKLDFTDVPEPSIGGEEALVEVKACGICGSDVHGLDGSTGRRIPPLVMGHEASGVVRAVGGRVDGWKPGDRVTFDSTVSCGSCLFCRRGEINLCDNRRVLGVSCAEYRRDGAFAELVAVPARGLYRLPDALSFEHAAFVEPVSIAVHALSRRPPALGSTVLVAGAGIIGLLLIQLLRASGAGRIIAVDLDETKLEAALRAGADAAAKPGDADALVARETSMRGVDAAFEAVGVAATFGLAVRSVRKGGAVTLVGNLAPSAEMPLQAAVTRELSLFGSCGSQGEYPACLDLIARGAIDVGSLLSETMPLSEGERAFRRLRERESGLLKIVLLP